MLQLLLLIASSLAWGVEGQFSFDGGFTVESYVRYETVYPSSSAGQNRLQHLRDQGYACQSKLQFVQCHKQYETTALPEGFKKLSPNAETVEFGPLLSMELLSQGDDVAIYSAHQTVAVDGVLYNEARYIERPDSIKVSVGESGTPNYHSFLVHMDSVSMLEAVTHVESKWAYSVYYVEYFFSKAE